MEIAEIRLLNADKKISSMFSVMLFEAKMLWRILLILRTNQANK